MNEKLFHVKCILNWFVGCFWLMWRQLSALVVFIVRKRIPKSNNKILLFVMDFPCGWHSLQWNVEWWIPLCSLEFIIISFRLKCALLPFIHDMCLLSLHSNEVEKEEDIYLFRGKNRCHLLFQHPKHFQFMEL